MAVGEALGSLGRARPTTAVVARPAPRSPSVGLLRRSGGRGIVRGGLGLAPRPRALAEPKREREKSDEEVPSTSRRGDGLDAGDDAGASDPSHGSVNDYIRSGGSERRWLLKQAAKTSQKEHRRKIGSVLKSFAGDSRGSPPDVVVVGCGPAGLALACSLAEEAERRRTGVKVGLIGPDVPFVNTYGVWEDEFADLGMSECLETVFEDAHCFFGEGAGGRVSVGRSYAKVDLEGLQNHLVDRCERRRQKQHRTQNCITQGRDRCGPPHRRPRRPSAPSPQCARCRAPLWATARWRAARGSGGSRSPCTCRPPGSP